MPIDINGLILQEQCLLEQDIWDFIDISLCKPSTKLWKKEKIIKENRMAIETATRIIKEGVNNNIFNNIINITNPKNMWEKL